MEIINGFFKIKKGRYKYSQPEENISEPMNTSFHTGVDELEPFFENVSIPVQHFVMTKSVSRDFLAEIANFTKDKFPNNEIDWDSTQKMVDYVLEFKKLCSEKVSQIEEGKNGPYINIMHPNRVAKIDKIKRAVLKQLNDKYNPGMYCLPTVP